MYGMIKVIISQPRHQREVYFRESSVTISCNASNLQPAIITECQM